MWVLAGIQAAKNITAFKRTYIYSTLPVSCAVKIGIVLNTQAYKLYRPWVNTPPVEPGGIRGSQEPTVRRSVPSEEEYMYLCERSVQTSCISKIWALATHLVELTAGALEIHVSTPHLKLYPSTLTCPVSCAPSLSPALYSSPGAVGLRMLSSSWTCCCICSNGVELGFRSNPSSRNRTKESRKQSVYV